MDDDSLLEKFVAFSAEVTAFKTFELHGTGLAPAYLETAVRVVGRERIAKLVEAHRSIAAKDDARVRELRVRIFGDEELGPIGRNILKLWYVGTWFALSARWQDRYGPAPQDGTFVVSPAAYIEGLLWKAAGAHPPGGRAPGFGSWADPPKIPEF